jgi:mRNA-degrading endonuclease YafQ of YafQ-DinJ toxin-antitoxin module
MLFVADVLAWYRSLGSVRRTRMNAVLEKAVVSFPLVGNYADRNECHIEPDWLLIYKFDTGIIISGTWERL